MASPTIRSSTVVNETANATSRNITKPTGTASGDWLILIAAVDGVATGSYVPPSGFSEVLLRTTGTGAFCAIHVKEAGGSEGASYTVGTASETCSFALICIDGSTTTASTVAELIDSMSSAQGTSTYVLNPDMYVRSNDTLVFRVCAADGGATASITQPGSHTSIVNNTSGGTTRVSFSVCHADQASAGYAGKLNHTLSAADDWVGVTFAVASTTTQEALPAHPVIAGLSYAAPDAVTALTYPKPWNTIDGDLLVLIQCSDTTGILSNPGSAFTSRHSVSNTAIWLYILSRIASSEGSSYTGSNTTSSAKQGVLLRIINHDPTNYWDDSGTATGTDASPTASTLTPTYDNCINLAGFAADDDDVTDDTGYTATYTGVFKLETTYSNDSSLMLQRKEQTTATATGSIAMTMGASEEWIAYNILIAPTPAGGGGGFAYSYGFIL